MDGLIMDWDLTIPRILDRARKVFPHNEVVSNLPEGRHSYTWAEFYGRVVRLMNVLRKLGVKRGDRVATFAWNHYRHLELYFAIPCCGAILHTLNLRLFPEQLQYIVNHAEDSMIFVDDNLLRPIEAMAGKFESVKQYVVMGPATDLPETTLAPVANYETLMAEASDVENFPEIGEREACGLCYTSGTTGNPKGVLYSHRGTFIHTMMVGMTDVLGLSERDVMMPVVPMFHANAWGNPGTFHSGKFSPRQLSNIVQFAQQLKCIPPPLGSPLHHGH